MNKSASVSNSACNFLLDLFKVLNVIGIQDNELGCFGCHLGPYIKKKGSEVEKHVKELFESHGVPFEESCTGKNLLTEWVTKHSKFDLEEGERLAGIYRDDKDPEKLKFRFRRDLYVVPDIEAG